MSALDEAGADQRLASFIDRDSQRTKRDALWDKLSTPKGCVEYCVERCAGFVRSRGQLAGRLFYRAGLLMGRDGDAARGMIITAMRRGGFDGVQAWLAEPPAMPPWILLGPKFDQIGFVYTARLVNYDYVLKVGFSQDPDRRMKELECKFGEPMKLIAAEVGTMLDEAHAHISAGRRYIWREFMFAPDFDDVRPGNIPDFLLGPFSQRAGG